MTPWISLVVPGIGLHAFRSDASRTGCWSRSWCGSPGAYAKEDRCGDAPPGSALSVRSTTARRVAGAGGTWVASQVPKSGPGAPAQAFRAGLLVNESQQSFGFAVGAAEGDGDGVIFVDDVNGVGEGGVAGLVEEAAVDAGVRSRGL